MNLTSLKTTLFGCLTAIAIYLKSYPDGVQHTIGVILEPLSVALLGFFARDNNVTSEQSGASAITK